ncbi:MAG: zinc ribbon domain-containing protein [Bacteroidales bacterium]|nr:zinc ribbon domain-containing protein [Bacteroidales bacterium]
MKCLKCNAEIADNAKFCPICGAKVEIENKCPNCGATVEKNAKFCVKCGTKIENWNEEKDTPSPISEQSTAEITESTIVKHGEEPLAVNASEPLPVANSSTTVVKKNNSAKKTIIIIAFVFVAVTIVALVSEYVISLVLKSGKQSNYSSYSYDNDYSSNINLNNTYYNVYISFKYPSNYKITDEEYNEDGEISLNCEIKGDDLSIITITCGIDESLSFYDAQDYNEICKEALKSINEGFRSGMYVYGYDNVKISGMSRKTIGNYFSGYYNDFTAEVYSNPIKGYIFVGTYGNTYVTIFAQAENDKYLRQLDDILKTLEYADDGRGSEPDYDDI